MYHLNSILTDNTSSVIITLNSIYNFLKFNIYVKYSWKPLGNQLSKVECNHKVLIRLCVYVYFCFTLWFRIFSS